MGWTRCLAGMATVMRTGAPNYVYCEQGGITLCPTVNTGSVLGPLGEKMGLLSEERIKPQAEEDS